MSESLRVFVSSVMIGGYLAAEREQVRLAIDSLQLTVPWTFENEPAESAPPIEVALQAVKRSDIFVLLVKDAHSEPVEAEIDEAERGNKPVLAFVERRSREDESDARSALLQRLANYKYREYDGLDQLAREVLVAIRKEIVEGYRDRYPVITDKDIRTLVKGEADQADTQPRLAVRPASPGDREAVFETLMELEQWYPDIGPWARRRVDELGENDDVRVADVGGAITGVVVARDKDEGIRKLSTLYVRPTGQGAALGPHLVREEVVRAEDDGIRKAYVTCADEVAELLMPILRQNGFMVEGVSSGRYREGSAEWVLGKTFVYEQVDESDFVEFVRARLVVEAGGSIGRAGEDPAIFDTQLPRFPIAGSAVGDTIRFVVSTAPEPEEEYERYSEELAGRPWIFVSMCGRPATTSSQFHRASNWTDGADIEARFYPVQIDSPGQRSLIVTIRPEFADNLIPRSAQPPLFTPTRLQLRPDNVFYRSPDRYRDLRRGSRIFFYVSEPERAVRGWGVVTSAHVGSPGDCFARYGTKGVFDYDALERIAENARGEVLAIAFDWYREFSTPVSFRDLQQIVSGYNPQAASVIRPEDARRIVERGAR